MGDEIQEIKRLIGQSTELSDSLIRLARKLQWQDKKHDREQAVDLRALHAKLTDLRSYIDVLKREIGPQRYDEAYAKARQAVAEQTATPQEAVIELLCAAVADKTMSAGQAVEQLVKLLRADLPVSRRIAIREAAKAAFETGDDIMCKIRPFLKNDSTEQQRKVNRIGYFTNSAQAAHTIARNRIGVAR
jgi:hypothetical protein